MISFRYPRLRVGLTRSLLLPALLIVGAGCHDDLPTALRDELALQSEMADCLVRVVDENTAKEYSFYRQRFDKGITDRIKRENTLSDDLGTGKGGVLKLRCTACNTKNDNVKPEEFRAIPFDELGKCAVCKNPDAKVSISGGGPDENTGAKMEWDAFQWVRIQTIKTLTVPDRVVFQTNYYNQYLRERVALEIINRREMARVLAVFDNLKNSDPDADPKRDWPKLQELFPDPNKKI